MKSVNLLPISADDQVLVPMGAEQVLAICGKNEAYLSDIESRLKVRIETPGSGFLISGPKHACAMTKQVILFLSERFKRGAKIEMIDVREAFLDLRTVSIDNTSYGGGAIPSQKIASELIVMGKKGPVFAKTKGQLAYVSLLQSRDLVFGLGPAGSGKTFLAVAYGLSRLLSKKVERLVITRPAVEAGENLGFLPGDLNEKVDPYLAPIWQALNDIMGKDEHKKARDDGRIEVAPLAYMRGRTLSRAHVIVDEAQNTTRAQMKMILTRIGEGSTMTVTGDPSQIDLVKKSDSGLIHAVNLLGRLKGVGVSRLGMNDIVRHALVGRILRAYDRENSSKTLKSDG